jgi:hypothetical protein
MNLGKWVPRFVWVTPPTLPRFCGVRECGTIRSLLEWKHDFLAGTWMPEQTYVLDDGFNARLAHRLC